MASDNDQPEHQAPEPAEELEVPKNALATIARLWDAMVGLRWRIVAFYSFNDLVMASFAERLNLRLRERISAKLARLPLSYFDAHQPGDTISRATNDLDKVSEVLQRGVLQLLTSVMTVVGAVLIMLTVDVRLACIFLAFAAVALAVTKVFATRTLKVATVRQASLGVLTGRVEEAYSGRAVIKAFGRDEASAGEVLAAAQSLADSSASSDFLTNAVGPAIRFVMRLCQVTIAVLAGQMLIAGQLSVGVFQAFFQYVTQASEPLTQLGLTVNMLQGAIAAAERVFSLLDEPEVEADPADALAPVEPVRGRVAFEHVRFGYSADKPLMRDVSLVAEPGQKVAIVGATGAGKTTLINILAGKLAANAGDFKVFGHAGSERSVVRQLIGVVPQFDIFFDNLTVREHLTLVARLHGVRRAEEAMKVRVAAQRVGLDRDAFNMTATLMSGGQKRRLSLAMAMVGEPQIVFMDEPSVAACG